jgi:zinc transporter ZupT
MMVTNSLILFLSAFLGGISIFFFPVLKERKFDFLLIFAGSYLFSITIIHILPEVFAQYQNSLQIGIFVLVGFFLQMVLGVLSTGVEHGHIHHIDKNEKFLTPSVLLIGLGLHAFLEGTILAHPVSSNIHNHAGGILFGIVLHKIPAALALMVILNAYSRKTSTAIIYLIIFSLCSPFGLIVASIVGAHHVFTVKEMSWLYAIVSGSFLHISTTIFFESNPQHKLKVPRLFIVFLGALVAILIEVFL